MLYLYGILNCSFWGYVLATIIFTQITIAAVTLYLHRNQSHRAIDLHPSISHFFRFWLWLTTGMVTSEWVAIHRKHHASVDQVGDPHSPVVLGIKKVFWEGAELYKEAYGDRPMIEKYSHGTPNDWIERHLYAAHPVLGLALMLVINLVLFGLPGISIWGIQMLWIPLHAAGVINGIGHHWGYRNFESKDASTNIVPWGLWIGGEELHNNHHAFASSAKFSVRWWEVDIGWFYIRTLSLFGLATVKKLPPKMAINKNKVHIDMDTVKALIQNRLEIMSHYYKKVSYPTLLREKQRSFKRLFRLQDSLLSKSAQLKLEKVLAEQERLKLVYAFKQSLQNIWLKAAKSQKELVEAVQVWCKQAEESGLDVLQQFAQHIKTLVPVS